MQEPERICSRCGTRYESEVIFCPKDGTPLGEKKTELSNDPYLELVLAEQFRIEQLIGIGAMGRVYRAHQKGIERPVAVKIIHRELLRNPVVMGRFQREARVASRLTHPNVVQVLTTGEIPKTGADVGGEAYLVMEYLDGISLRSALAASGGAIPLPRALHLVLQVCDAVGEAHAQGIVHRDLKPENVMLVRRGDDSDFVKVLDFGVARIEWADGSVATQAGVIFGTARYISPEGAQGKPVGPQSDVYSLSVMLFQCLSGQTPFDADNPVGILIKHTNEPPPDVRSIPRSSYVPEPLAALLEANLSKNPQERCRDGRELGRALLDAARASGLSADDLLMRSTLLRGGSSALHLQSLQRTKSLALTTELATRLSSGTVSDEPIESGRSSRPSGIEPTLTDEPASEVLSRPSSPAVSRSGSWPSTPPASASGPFGVPHSSPFASSPMASSPIASSPLASPALTTPIPPRMTPIPPRVTPIPPSNPRASYPEPSEVDIPMRERRRFLVAGCFLVGAGLALFAAERLGAFASAEPNAASYAERARNALEREAWDAPPGENVRDITDGALRRWPGARAVIEIRETAAKSLLEKARALADDRPGALRFARLASELDPKNEPAHALVAELESASEPTVPPQPETSTVDAGRQPLRRSESPKRVNSNSATPPASASSAGTRDPAGGRWL